MAPCNNSSHRHSKDTFVQSSILSFIGLPGNLLIIILIYRAKQKKSTATYLLLSLAIADIINLLSVDVIAIIVLLTEKYRKKRATLFLLTVPAKIVANLTLAVIALERYNALVKTMKPFVKITKKKILIFVIIAWFISLAISMLIFFHKLPWKKCKRPDRLVHSSLIILFVAHIFPLVIVAFCYSSILKGLYFDHTILGEKITDVGRLSEKKRLICILIVVTLVFLACNVPTIIILLLKHYYVEGRESRRDVDNVVMILGILSSVLNPFIYGLQSKKYRSQVKELFCNKAGNRTVEPSPDVVDTKL